MKDSIVVKSILAIAGIIAMGFGTAILFFPVAFYASNGVALGNDINIINDLRAEGGSILASGIYMMVGIFISRIRYTATVIAALLYLSFGLSRIVSLVLDGIPVDGLIQAMVLEVIIGILCVVTLLKYRLDKPHTA